MSPPWSWVCFDSLVDDPFSQCARETYWLFLLPLSVAISTAASFTYQAYRRRRHQQQHPSSDGARIARERALRIKSLSGSTAMALFVAAAVTSASLNAYAAVVSRDNPRRQLAHATQTLLTLSVAIAATADGSLAVPYALAISFGAIIDCLLSKDVHRLQVALAVANAGMLSAATQRTNSPTRTKTSSATSPEEAASLWQHLTLSWVTPLLEMGRTRPLTVSDLWPLRTSITSAEAYRRFCAAAPPSSPTAKSLAWQLISSNQWPLALHIAGSILMSLTSFVEPYFVNRIVKHLQGTATLETKPLYYVVALFATRVVRSVARTQLRIVDQSTELRMNAQLTAAVYQKTITRRASHVGGSSGKDKPSASGKKGKSRADVSAILSGDISWILSSVGQFERILTSPITLVGSLYGLYQLVGVAAFAGLAMLLLSLLNDQLVAKVGKRQRSERWDIYHERVTKTNEFMHGIRTIKLFAWEAKVRQLINDLRDKEEAAKTHQEFFFTILGIWCSLLPTLVTSATLFIYTAVLGRPLDAAQLLTTTSLLGMLQWPLHTLSRIRMTVLNASEPFSRVADFLAQPDFVRYQLDTAGRVGFVNATLMWTPDVADEPPSEETSLVQDNAVTTPVTRFQLRDLTIAFPAGKLTLVAGATGQGKSSLLSALLGEMYPISGQVFLPRSDRNVVHKTGLYQGVGYVPQTAWLLNATIRDNILFGDDYEQNRYQRVLRDCALIRDLQILEGGDNTEIGEKGINLSGGQKQRISLARACYNRAQIVLMDDVLSAVDAPTAAHIFKQCIAGPNAQLARRTRVLVTHNVGLTAPRADWIVFMKDGEAVAQGPTVRVVHDQLIAQGLEDASLLAGALELSESWPNAEVEKEFDHDLAEKEGTRITDAENKHTGAVSWKMYRAYITVVGVWSCVLFFVLASAVPNWLSIFKDWWGKHWSDAYLDGESVKVGYYAAIHGGIDIIMVLISTCEGLGWRSMSVRSSRLFHDQLLDSILAAPILFFDRTPVARIITRLSSDVNQVGSRVQFALQGFAYSIIASASGLAVIAVIAPFFTAAFVPIAIACYMCAIFYQSSSRELKRLASTTRSPIYTHASETVAGCSVIRAFDASSHFTAKLFDKVDTYHGADYYNDMASMWYTLRTSFLSSLTVLVYGLFVCYYKHRLDAGLAGMALTYCQSLVHHCVGLIDAHAHLERSMGSVERVVEYIDMKHEAPAVIEGSRPPAAWPTDGAIKVRDLVVQYSTELGPVLRNVSFDVRSGEKIGICGRTGAGKSTLALALLRIMEPSSGSVTIDGVDISSIGLADLRSRVTIIPQDPVLFAGTIRSNLDVFGEHDDSALLRTLQRVHLHSDGDDASNITLDSPVSEGGSNYSVGQRQLLTLARALLRRSKVIIMDESTANVSHDLDAKIQETIRTEFADSTILCIAHRLRTVIDFDRILVLDHGEVCEYDTPHNLLQLRQGVFRNMCMESGEYEHLASIAGCA